MRTIGFVGVVMVLVASLVATTPGRAAAVDLEECTIVGTEGPDVIFGTNGEDIICPG